MKNFAMSKSLIRAAAAIGLAASAHHGAVAAQPTCHLYNSQPYGQYTGLVKQAYVNGSNALLLYFDTPFASAADINIPGATITTACIVDANGRMDFAKMFYASALTAQASGRSVTVQMWGSFNNYPVCDRIWVNG